MGKLKTETEKCAFDFTAHALIRLGQRTQITRDEILEQLKLGRDIAANTLCIEQGRLFWSPKDQRVFLAIYDIIIRKVITVMDAYRFTDAGQFRGTPYTEHGIAGHPTVRRYVKFRHVRDYMISLGVPLGPEFEVPENAAPTQRVYEGLLRLERMDEEGRHTRQVRLGTFRVNDAADEIDLEELLEALLNKQAVLQTMPGIIAARVELRERNATAPEREIELHPRGIHCLQPVHEDDDKAALIHALVAQADGPELHAASAPRLMTRPCEARSGAMGHRCTAQAIHRDAGRGWSSRHPAAAR